jgi:hypothetical protein
VGHPVESATPKSDFPNIKTGIKTRAMSKTAEIEMPRTTTPEPPFLHSQAASFIMPTPSSQSNSYADLDSITPELTPLPRLSTEVPETPKLANIVGEFDLKNASMADEDALSSSSDQSEENVSLEPIYCKNAYANCCLGDRNSDTFSEKVYLCSSCECNLEFCLDCHRLHTRRHHTRHKKLELPT